MTFLRTHIVMSKQVALALSIVLALLEAGQQLLHIGSWHAYLSMAIVALGVIGIKAASKDVVAKLLGAQYAAIAAAVIGALEVFQHEAVNVPRGVHAVIGGIIVLAAAVGISVVDPFNTGQAEPPA